MLSFGLRRCTLLLASSSFKSGKYLDRKPFCSNGFGCRSIGLANILQRIRSAALLTASSELGVTSMTHSSPETRRLKLTGWADDHARSGVWQWFLLSWAVLGLATALWWSRGEEALTDWPQRHGDDVFFENIAWNFWQYGFVSVDFSSAAWREPYEQANGDGRYDWFLGWRHRGLTTSRAPGFPVFAGIVYQIAGRNPAAVRVGSALVGLSGLAFLLAVVRIVCGWQVAAVALATLSADFFVLRALPQFMSEGLGIGLLSLLVGGSLAAPHRDWERRGWLTVTYLGLGVVFAAAMLVRSNLNFWYLLLAVGGALYGWYSRFMKGRFPSWWGCWFWFLLAATAVSLPWWIRNCRISHGFAPFGTSGTYGLSGAYCDESYRQFGNWSLETAVATSQQAVQSPGFGQLDLPRQEFVLGQYSLRQAASWIMANFEKLPALMAMRMASHLGFYGQPLWLMLLNGGLLVGALIGAWRFRSSVGVWIFLGSSLSLVTVALTWEHFGRYSLPIRPMIHVGFGMSVFFLPLVDDSTEGWREELRIHPPQKWCKRGRGDGT